MNNFHSIVRLGRDPKKETAADGKIYTKFTAAENIGYGEKKRTNWWTIVCFNKLAENVAKFLVKGSQVYVEGNVDISTKYTDKNGVERISISIIANDIIFLNNSQNHIAAGTAANTAEKAQQNLDMPDDDIPF